MTEETFITIGNRGKEIASTNYFDSELAGRGILFLSWNAGAARLLLPDVQMKLLREMRTAKNVGIYQGTLRSGVLALEILFDDFSDYPFVMRMGHDQTDRYSRSGMGIGMGNFPFSVWTRTGMKMCLQAKLHIVPMLPANF